MMKMILLMTALTFASVPGFAQETPQDQYLCKLQAGNCLKQAEVVQRKMQKKEAEIQSGKKVYSTEELRQIELKLEEVEQMIDNLKAK